MDKELIYNWVPPAAISAIQSFLDFFRPAPYEFIEYEWPQNQIVSGWSSQSVENAREKSWNAFLDSMEGHGPFGLREDDLNFPSSLKINTHNLFMSYAYCLCLACHNKQTISILDWGGGLGNYFILSKKLITDIEIDYHCVDLPLACETGRRLLPKVVFYDTDTWQNRSYDFVFSSSSIQYLEDWQSTVIALIKTTNRYLYVTRMPFVQSSRSFVMLQRAKEYKTEYLGWVLNRSEFINFVKLNGMKLKREFVNHIGPRINKAPEQNIYMGFLFEKAKSDLSE